MINRTKYFWKICITHINHKITRLLPKISISNRFWLLLYCCSRWKEVPMTLFRRLFRFNGYFCHWISSLIEKWNDVGSNDLSFFYFRSGLFIISYIFPMLSSIVLSIFFIFIQGSLAALQFPLYKLQSIYWFRMSLFSFNRLRDITENFNFSSICCSLYIGKKCSF